MLNPISEQEYNDFKDFLEKHCGIMLGEAKQYLVTSRLSRLLKEQGMKSFTVLLAVIQDSGNTVLRDKVIDIMTTNETSWFRDQAPFDCLNNRIFQEIEDKGMHYPLRIWSAACSSGQEPYTISILLSEYLESRTASRLANAQIVATDISETMLETARQACYDESQLGRGLSGKRRQRFFKQDNDKWQVIEAVRQRVHFQKLNLLARFDALGQFDIIFCRNVLIYFSPERKTDILNRMAARMNPGGYLFLGASETITGYSDAFEMIRSPYGVYYRLKS